MLAIVMLAPNALSSMISNMKEPVTGVVESQSALSSTTAPRPKPPVKISKENNLTLKTFMMFSPKEAAGMPMETRLGRTQMSTSSKLTIEPINSMNELPPSNNFPLRTTEEVVTLGGISEVPNT
jgi:hypothetical protein